ncbi:MAG: ABC transporter ATP-binding protein/permease [Victivallaceae bacterium]|nr:ABC transporter ATP-binding protein/permease [Victivallaceae bacterium]
MSKSHFPRTLFGGIFAEPFRRYSYGILCLECLLVAVRCFSPLIQRFFIDALTSGASRAAFLLMAATGAALFCGFALESGENFLRGKLHIAARRHLQGGLFRHLLALPEDFLRSRGAGYFFNRMQNDVGEVLVFWRGSGISLFGDVLKLVIALGTIAVFSWRCALFALPFLSVQALICFLFRGRQYELSRHLQECVASERHVMQDYLSNHTTVKTHAALQNASTQVETGLSRWGELAGRRLFNEYLFRICLQLPIWLCTGAVAFAGVYFSLQKTWTLGETWSLVTLTMLLFAPARAIGNIFVQMESARSAWTRLTEILRRQSETEGENSDSFRLTGDIVFDGVSFGYGDRAENVLEEISFRVPAGALLFLRGANGSGKSTLLALMLRLYKARAGQICIGGRDIEGFPLTAYRSRIGYIGQHPEFVKGNVRSNLALGNKFVPDEEMVAMLRKLDFWKIVADRGGLDAEVEENGENFSGGERLRLALAREMLRDIDLLLFDEPAAHLDQEGRERFYRLIRDFHGRKSVLAAVHGPAEIDGALDVYLPERDPAKDQR